MKLKLATEEVIVFDQDYGIGDIIVNLEKSDDIPALYEKLTAEGALDKIEIINDDEVVIGKYSNCKLNALTSNPAYKEVDDEQVEYVEAHISIFIMSNEEVQLKNLTKRVDTLEEEMTEVQEAVVEG